MERLNLNMDLGLRGLIVKSKLITEATMNEMLPLPLNSIEDLKKFDLSLTNEQVKNKWIRHINYLVSDKLDMTIRLILKSVYTDELARQISWLGRKKNFKIADRYHIHIIEEILKKNQKFTKLLFETTVKNWLRYTSTRIKRSKQKAIMLHNYRQQLQKFL